ncbi:hypothetical protein HAX54_041257 [Datura stramonium]|uniref:Uncharacterized protein n=1 Tax=Datura stramonium TaxID=4076 RepID=A0ABS8VQ82_DATST|nr:hypothetical protein [Datura stramonium]
MEIGEQPEEKMQNLNNGATAGSGKSRRLLIWLHSLLKSSTLILCRCAFIIFFGTISPRVEFTAKDFRDSAISVRPLLGDLNSVFVCKTNRIFKGIKEALVSPFLLDDSVEDAETNCLSDSQEDEQLDPEVELIFRIMIVLTTVLKILIQLQPTECIQIMAGSLITEKRELAVGTQLSLASMDSVHRATPVYQPSFKRLIVLSLLFDKASKFLSVYGQNWGQVDNSRHDFCFLCVNASLSTLDPFVDRRVDHMVDAGLLKEVLDIYTVDDYTKVATGRP